MTRSEQPITRGERQLGDQLRLVRALAALPAAGDFLGGLASEVFDVSERAPSLAMQASPAVDRPPGVSTHDGGVLDVQSIDVLAEAQRQGLGDFDLVICDEAHRTTGVTLADTDESHVVKVHDNEVIRAAKRLYMTAT